MKVAARAASPSRLALTIVACAAFALAGLGACSKKSATDQHTQQSAQAPAGGMPGAMSGGAQGGASGMLGGAPPHAPMLHYKTPQGWIQEPPASQMRLAQYRLPRAEGDPENASLALFYFGPQAGGGTQANIDRWISQMSGANGGPPTNHGLTQADVNGLKVSTVDVSGTYAGDSMMGGAPTPKPNYRLLASVVETPAGNYYLKLTGPEATVQKWLAGYQEMLKSVSVASNS